MKKNNQKGFVLLETIIVTVFIIGIFTFVYMSVVPLIGKYSELENNYELEQTYKLYHIRDAIYKDVNFNNIVSAEYKIISLNDFNDKDYYGELTETIFGTGDYQIVYIKNISDNLNIALSNLSIGGGFKEYIKNVKKNKASEDYQNFIFLKEGKKYAHLGLSVDLNDLTKYTD